MSLTKQYVGRRLCCTLCGGRWRWINRISEKQSSELVGSVLPLHRPSLAHYRIELLAARRVEIGEHPTPHAHRLADVEDISVLIEHPVYAGAILCSQADVLAESGKNGHARTS